MEVSLAKQLKTSLMYGNDSILANIILCEEQDKLSCRLPHCPFSPFLNPTFVDCLIMQVNQEKPLYEMVQLRRPWSVRMGHLIPVSGKNDFS